MKYSFTLVLIPAHLPSKHNGINNVVNKIKNSEIPSTPKVKLIFAEASQSKRSTN
jgi:hypothetical protein